MAYNFLYPAILLRVKTLCVQFTGCIVLCVTPLLTHTHKRQTLEWIQMYVHVY